MLFRTVDREFNELFGGSGRRGDKAVVIAGQGARRKRQQQVSRQIGLIIGVCRRDGSVWKAVIHENYTPPTIRFKIQNTEDEDEDVQAQILAFGVATPSSHTVEQPRLVRGKWTWTRTRKAGRLILQHGHRHHGLPSFLRFFRGSAWKKTHTFKLHHTNVFITM